MIRMKAEPKTVRKIPHLRWWITALLFLSTVINYVDRQTLSVLASTIQKDLGIDDLGYSHVVEAFLFSYTVCYLFAGRITDWLGTRVSMTLFTGWWSVANMLTSLARSAFSLGVFRFLLGIGEPGNYTVISKTVSEWFPPKERGLAYGICTAGATIGATVASPSIAYFAVHHGWRASFVITGSLGLLWLVPWVLLYRNPREHPRMTEEDRALVESYSEPANAAGPAESEWQRWKSVLRRSDAWLLLLCRVLTDPVWYFYLFWFPKYLSDARHLTLIDVGMTSWIVYLAADVGSILGGWASGRFIRKGLGVIRSRLRVMTIAACVMPLSALLVVMPTLPLVLVATSCLVLAQLAWQVTLGALIVDLYPQRVVATVFGVIAAGSGIGGMLSTGIIGHLVTSYSYSPVFVLLGMVHPLALVLLWQLRRSKAHVVAR
jgi:MFS transporter, ACS family, hexuronate transporter